MNPTSVFGLLAVVIGAMSVQAAEQNLAAPGPLVSQNSAPICCAIASDKSAASRSFQSEGVSTFASKLFDTNDYPARWYCGTWARDVGWLHIISDLGIFTAYFAIPCVLLFFMLRKRDLPFPKIIWLFATFIMACGLGHLIEAGIFWWPVYRFSGLVKFFTAVISWATVVVLIRIMPSALRLPSAALLANKLIRSQERLNIALDSARIGVLEIDLHRKLVIADARTRELFGLDGLSDADHFDQLCQTIHSEDRHAVIAAFTQAVNQRQLYTIEFRVVHPDGSMRYIQSQGKFVEDSTHAQPGVAGWLIGVWVDITEKHAKDAALLESEQNFRGTFENAAIGIAHVSVDGVWTKVNPVLCQILGFAAPEIVGKSYQDLTHSDDRETTLAQFNRAIAGHCDAYCLEKRYLRKDGTPVWVRVSASLVRDIHGVPTHFVKVIEDIDRRKQTELELQQYHERVEKLSLVASKTQHSVVITDAEGKIEWCNEAFTRLTGYTVESVLGRKPGDFLQGELTDPEVVATMRRCLQQRVSIATELINYHANGKPYWIELKIDPVLNEVGQLTNFIATQVDISERKGAEQNLYQAKQAAEQASKAKGEFLAAMSHELRTPLNGVIGMTELLSDSDLDPRQQRFVDACRKSGQHLLTLINDILDFSKIESGKLELDRHPFDLLQLVSDVVETLTYRVEQKGLQMKHHLAYPETLCLLGDSHRLRQVLTNLLGNAVKFTDRGMVSIEIEPVAVTTQQARLRFRVKDTGIGIPEDRQQKLFQEFSQVDRSASRRFNGTGLGLSISKSIVEAMGGTIGVKSIEGLGSEFWFEVEFPRIESHENTAAANDATSINTQTSLDESNALRVLLAEDNPTNQMFASEILARRGWQCVVASNGREAVEAIQRSTFDVVLMDCQMPEMDGFAATAAIRNWERTSDRQRAVPIIALTANAIKGDQENCLASGMNAYLSKPFTPPALVELINSVVAAERESADSNSTAEHAASADSSAKPATTPVGLNEAQAPIDELKFIQQRCMGDIDFALSLLDSFVASSSKRLQEIVEAAQCGDSQTAGMSAHSLKGTAGIVVANELTRLAAQIEEAGRTNDLPTIESLVDDLGQEVAACHEFIAAYSARVRMQASDNTQVGTTTFS